MDPKRSVSIEFSSTPIKNDGFVHKSARSLLSLYLFVSLVNFAFITWGYFFRKADETKEIDYFNPFGFGLIYENLTSNNVTEYLENYVICGSKAFLIVLANQILTFCLCGLPILTSIVALKGTRNKRSLFYLPFLVNSFIYTVYYFLLTTTLISIAVYTLFWPKTSENDADDRKMIAVLFFYGALMAILNASINWMFFFGVNRSRKCLVMEQKEKEDEKQNTIVDY